MPYKFATFQTNEISFLTSCIKTGSYGVDDLAFKPPKYDLLKGLRDLRIGDRIFIHLKSRVFCGPFFVTNPHSEFKIDESVGVWHKVNVAETPSELRPVWLSMKPWCFFFDQDLSLQVNYCYSALLSYAGFKLPALGMINDEEGDRLWKMIDEKGRPFADFIQRQGRFAYSGFSKSAPIHFHQVATQRRYLSNSDNSNRYKSKNGVLVRSKSETLIANFLHDRGYRFEYERSTLLGKNIIRPDFYLPDYDVFIEHLGLYNTNPEYRQDWVWRENLYKSNSCKVVTTLESDIPNLDTVLLRKLASVGCLLK